jgi:hypothetical protein
MSSFWFDPMVQTVGMPGYGGGPQINTDYGGQLAQQQAYVAAQNQAALAAAASMGPGYGQVHLPGLSGSFGEAAAPGTYSPGSGLSSFSGTPLSGGGGDPWAGTGFDPIQYLHNNPDVAGATGGDPMKAYGHATTFGAQEGRTGAEMFNAPRQYGWDTNEGASAPAAPQVYNKGEFNPHTYGWDHNEGAPAPPTPSFDDIWNGRGAADTYQNNEWFNQPVWQRKVNEQQQSPMDLLDRYQWPTGGGYDVGGQSRSYANPMNRVDWASSFGDNSPALKDTLRQWGAESGGRYDPDLDRLSGQAWSYLNDPNNIDLRNTFGTDIGAAAQHAQAFGKNEGRNLYGLPGSTGATEYMNANRDVFDAFGGDPLKAAQHWQSYGQFEGRDPHGLSKSSAAQYLDANKDLRDTFGNDPQKAEQHWQRSGQFEGRGGFGMQKSPAAQYLEANPDVAQTVGNDPAKALQHYQHFGQKEGREGYGIQTRYDIAKALAAQTPSAAPQMPSGQFGGENTNTYGVSLPRGYLGMESIYKDPFSGYVQNQPIADTGGENFLYLPRYDAQQGFQGGA